MSALLFMPVGLMAGEWGLFHAVIAAMEQKEAKKVHERANSLLRSLPAEKEADRKEITLVPMMSALKEGMMPGARAGIMAAFVTYGAAMNLAVAGKIIALARDNGRAVRFTVLAALGDGSLLAAAAVLAGIAVSVAGAVLCCHARDRAAENVKMAYENLFEAKRIRRRMKGGQ